MVNLAVFFRQNMMSEKEDIFIEDFYNMILGGLIALKSAQQAGICNHSLASETIFLGKWLKRVKKQKYYVQKQSLMKLKNYSPCMKKRSICRTVFNLWQYIPVISIH